LSGTGSISADGVYLDTAAFLNGIAQDSGVVTNLGTITANGQYVINDGTLSLKYGIVNAPNSVYVGPGAPWQHAILSGYGSVNTNVYNKGEIDTVANAPAPLTIYGHFTQYGGVTNVVNFSELDVADYAAGNAFEDGSGGSFDLRGGNVFVDYSAVFGVGEGYHEIAGYLFGVFATFNVGHQVVLDGGMTEMVYGAGLSAGGALTVTNAKLWMYYNNADFGGTTTINGGGTMELDAANLNTASVIVNAGAVLMGTGGVSSSVTNAGEIDASPFNVPGTLTIAGSLTQTAGVTNISNSSNYSPGKLAVGGVFNEEAGTVNLIGGGTLEGALNILSLRVAAAADFSDHSFSEVLTIFGAVPMIP
jgi:hypothetical protein